jgi:hypothetical protein
MPLLGIPSHNAYAIVDRVQFCFFAQATRAGIGCIPPNGTDALVSRLRAIVRTFGVVLLFAIDDDLIGLDSAVRGENDRAVTQTFAGSDSFGNVALAVHR